MPAPPPPDRPPEQRTPLVDRERVDRDLFIAVTSHELRTPVTVIKGFADTLVEHWDALDPAGRRAAVRVIGQRAGELARLVDRLLAATTEPDGAPTNAPFDLVAALREAVGGGLYAELRRRLRVTLPESLPEAHGNRASLVTVLTELVTNATRHSSDLVDLSAHATEQEVTFAVADRGVGMPPEHLEQAFERYWQGEESHRRDHSGTGLGLYLVRQIVERQSGRVSLRPRKNGGTVAEVRLPRADVMADGAEQASEEAGDVDGGGRA